MRRVSRSYLYIRKPAEGVRLRSLPRGGWVTRSSLGLLARYDQSRKRAVGQPDNSLPN
jgi:hypothetical protein